MTDFSNQVCVIIERRQARILIGADARALDLMTRTLGSGYQSLARRAAMRADSLL